MSTANITITSPEANVTLKFGDKVVSLTAGNILRNYLGQVSLPTPNTPLTEVGGGDEDVVVVIPSSPQDVSSALSALTAKPVSNPSVVESAKAAKAPKAPPHRGVTVWLSKELDKDGNEVVTMVRTRVVDGKSEPDTKQNFGFDKSYSYHKGGGRWKLSKRELTVGKVTGTFWVRSIPVEDIELALAGIQEHHKGATLNIDGRAFEIS